MDSGDEGGRLRSIGRAVRSICIVVGAVVLAVGVVRFLLYADHDHSIRAFAIVLRFLGLFMTAASPRFDL